MCNTAASGGRRIGHDGHGGTLEQIWQRVFGNITSEFNSSVANAPLFYGLRVTRSLGMVSSCDYKLRLGDPRSDEIEGLDHQFEAFISAPLSKRENTLDGNSAPREVGEFRPAGKNPMRAQMDVVSSVLIVQDLAISRHEHRDGIREQQHSRSHCARQTI